MYIIAPNTHAANATNTSSTPSHNTPPLPNIGPVNDKIQIPAANIGKPMIISFWATWCKRCKGELNSIAEEYEDWVDETGVKLIAVSIDDARSSSRVEPYVNAQGWEYLVLMDPNSDLRRAMGVNNVPHTFLVNGEGKIVWDHNNYSPGDEEELYEKLTGL